MGDRQPHLNGAYYGPSIPPPPSKPKRRYETPRFGCCCFTLIGSCLRCCGCCILSLICNIVIAVAVILGVTALFLWLIFRPNAVKFYVTDANLNRFSFDSNNNSNNNLHYSLNLNFTIRNPNQRVGVYYDEIKVNGYYRGQRFGTGEISPFYQGHKNTAVIGGKIEGQNLIVLGDGAKADMKEEERSGVYRIDAKARMIVRFKFWLIKSWRFKPKIKCDDLKVPLVSSNSTKGFKFETINCSFDLS
ncbi:unnamed protein product [Cochlearia groenlandica]